MTILPRRQHKVSIFLQLYIFHSNSFESDTLFLSRYDDETLDLSNKRRSAQTALYQRERSSGKQSDTSWNGSNQKLTTLVCNHFHSNTLVRKTGEFLSFTQPGFKCKSAGFFPSAITNEPIKVCRDSHRRDLLQAADTDAVCSVGFFRWNVSLPALSAANWPALHF